MAGLFSSSAAQFNPDFSKPEGDIDYLRDRARGGVTGVSSAGQAELGLLDESRTKALDDLRAAQAGRLSTTSNQLALSGGATSGSAERLAQSSDRQGGFFTQGVLGDFAREESGIVGRDMRGQQDFNNQAALNLPGFSQGLAGIQAQVGAGNMQSQAISDQGKAQLIGGIGAGLGTAVGGPIGGMVGQGLFRSFLS